MKNLIHNHGKWILINMVIWCLAKELFLAIKIWGIESTTVERFQFPLSSLFFTIAITGLIDGFCFAVYDIITDRIFKSARFYQRVLIKAAINLMLGTIISMVCVLTIMQWIVGQDLHLFAKAIGPAQAIILAIYFLVNTVIVQFIKLVISWMKTDDVIELISHPHGIEEDRIFLFLDMKSSTSLAEELKTSLYSQMLRECFNDMSEAARETKTDIYQYVGDQAVMTWKETPENFIQAVKFHFNFQNKLKSRAAEYMEKFGTAPEFKAGIHHGRVIKAQVGMMRKEIAYHGDAINTASRIQSKCSELGKNLLVSESFKDNVADKVNWLSEGSFQIRGKKVQMNLFSINGINKDRPTENRESVIQNSIEFVRVHSVGVLKFIIKYY